MSFSPESNFLPKENSASETPTVNSLEKGVERTKSIIEELLKHHDPKKCADHIQHWLQRSQEERNNEEGGRGWIQMIEREANSLALGAALILLSGEIDKRHKGHSLGFMGKSDADKLRKYIPEINYLSSFSQEESVAGNRLLSELGELLEQFQKMA